MGALGQETPMQTVRGASCFIDANGEVLARRASGEIATPDDLSTVGAHGVLRADVRAESCRWMVTAVVASYL
jgi:hypothetical protein